MEHEINTTVSVEKPVEVEQTSSKDSPQNTYLGRFSRHV